MIDITTVFIVVVLMGALIATILAIVGKGIDDSLIYWATSYGINSVAFLLLAFRGQIPDLYSVILANIMIASSYALYAYGLSKYLNQTINLLLLWGPVLIVTLLFPFLSESMAIRIHIIVIVNAYQSLLLLVLLVRNANRLEGRGKFILASAFAIGGVIALSRPFALSLGIVEIASINSPGTFQSLTFLTLLLINVATALGLVLMLKEQAENRTSIMARTDELTGLPNRRSIYERITKMLAANDKNKRFGALLLIDLDNFKIVNDQHGHAMGDELLRQAANRISECMTEKDTAARLGGDEFVVLLSDLAGDRESAINIATERANLIREKLNPGFLLRQDIVHQCPGSVGVAILEPGAIDRESLMREADQAMYNDKAGNKAGSISEAHSDSAYFKRDATNI